MPSVVFDVNCGNPALSNERIVRKMLAALNQPSSPSAMTGTLTASTMLRASSTISFIETTPTSGNPSRAADVAQLPT
jgi:hypothetical protein